MMTFENVSAYVASLGTMPFFPSVADAAARLAIVELTADLTDDEEKVKWLVKRMKQLYRKWPGELEMRACFCSRFKPKDGIEAHSEVFAALDHFPDDPELVSKRIAAPKPIPLPPGRQATADPEMDRAVLQLAAGKAMPKPRLMPKLAEIVTGPRATPQVVTRADVDRALAEYRAKKAGGGQ